ncbi:MAG: entericidin A/B family lipoprotein [Alphaproteobacteria bacterium]
MKSSVKALMMLGATLLLLAACNTTAGMGKDISSAGSAITRGATRQ